MKRIQQFRTKHRLKTQTEAVVELMHVGLLVDARQEELKDPEIVRYLQENLYNQLLADWIFNLPTDRLEALYSTFRSARELRFTKRPV